MWFQITLIPLGFLLIVFFIFWIVHEGSRWQKHPQLGVFARFIQKSPKRGFLTFLILFILLIPAFLLVMTGMWIDALGTSIGPQRVDVVDIMLVLILILAFTFPVMYGALGTWRNARRAEAEMKVRPTGM
ncbi:MAG: hypothetical protein EAX87_06530 [Candidatus Thorarchaeota archaeon]|nr:hypothetical protein [Candidatus Thorarchaeota archaeon]